MTDQEMLAHQLQAMANKSKRALQAARAHLSAGDVDFASSKAYYAVFHLMQAALLTKEKTFSKHAGVISGFSEHFIKSGVFPKEFGETIQRLRKDRELGDYSYQLDLSTEEAAQDVENAATIFDSVLAYLKPWF
jgi:uncharacterized protein (UPF0332 family)